MFGDFPKTIPNGKPTIVPKSGSQTYSVPGTYQFKVHPGVYRIMIAAIGAGGGGNSSSGTGGGGGAACLDLVDVSPGQIVTITVGQGGTTSTNGGDTYTSVSSRAGGGVGGQSGTLGGNAGVAVATSTTVIAKNGYAGINSGTWSPDGYSSGQSSYGGAAAGAAGVGGPGLNQAGSAAATGYPILGGGASASSNGMYPGGGGGSGGHQGANGWAGIFW